jgi:hypothetical protein
MDKTNEPIDDVAIAEFQRLLSEDDYELFFQLGAGFVYEGVPSDVRFFEDYYKKGLEFWDALRRELYLLFCDPEQKKPKLWVEDVISGDIRNLATGIIAAITAHFNVGLGIAIPAAAILVKRGMLSYCQEPPDSIPAGTVQQLLLEEQKLRVGEVERVMKLVEQELEKKEKLKSAKRKKNKRT